MSVKWENWIRDMANGDKEALRQFYEETARPVYSFIFSVLKDPHESEDVMQETFLTVREHAGDYKPYGKPLAWVFTIAKRLCYMRLREKKKQAKILKKQEAERLAGQTQSERAEQNEKSREIYS